MGMSTRNAQPGLTKLAGRMMARTDGFCMLELPNTDTKSCSLAQRDISVADRDCPLLDRTGGSLPLA